MLFQHALSAAGAEIFHTGVETFPCLPGWVLAVTVFPGRRNIIRNKFPRIGILQQLSQHLLLQQLDLTLVCHTEIRIQTDLIKMIPDQEQAEAVDRGDLGIV